MKTTLIAILALVFGTLGARAQDTCAYLGQQNPCGMMIQVTGPVYCDDSADFSCITSEPLPFECGMMDTIGYDVCLYAHDGQWHSTTIYCGTSDGTISDQISLLAPAAAPAGVRSPQATPMIALQSWPDPVVSVLHLSMTDPSRMASRCEILDQRGTVLRNFSIEPGNMVLDLSNLASGAYLLRLRAGISTVLTKSFIVTH